MLLYIYVRSNLIVFKVLPSRNFFSVNQWQKLLTVAEDEQCSSTLEENELAGGEGG
jgi:hypothetical protein